MNLGVVGQGGGKVCETARDLGKPRGVHSSCSGVLQSEGFIGSVEVTGKVYKHCTGDNCTQLMLYSPPNFTSLLEDS